MTLIYNKDDDTYVWVETHDDNIELSPKYINEESAIKWYGRVASIMFKEFGVESEQRWIEEVCTSQPKVG